MKLEEIMERTEWTVAERTDCWRTADYRTDCRLQGQYPQKSGTTRSHTAFLYRNGSGRSGSPSAYMAVAAHLRLQWAAARQDCRFTGIHRYKHPHRHVVGLENIPLGTRTRVLMNGVAEVSRRMTTFRQWTRYEVMGISIWIILFNILNYWVMEYHLAPARTSPTDYPFRSIWRANYLYSLQKSDLQTSGQY